MRIKNFQRTWHMISYSVSRWHIWFLIHFKINYYIYIRKSYNIKDGKSISFRGKQRDYGFYFSIRKIIKIKKGKKVHNSGVTLNHASRRLASCVPPTNKLFDLQRWERDRSWYYMTTCLFRTVSNMFLIFICVNLYINFTIVFFFIF